MCCLIVSSRICLWHNKFPKILKTLFLCQDFAIVVPWQTSEYDTDLNAGGSTKNMFQLHYLAHAEVL